MENRGSARSIEAANVGWEGMVGMPLYLAHGIGSDEIVCQIGGRARRVTGESFDALWLSPPSCETRWMGTRWHGSAQITRDAGCCNSAHSPRSYAHDGC
jgi:hypothetical protein